MSFQLVPKSVTLNDLERRNGPWRYFSEFGSFRGIGAHYRYVKVVEDTPTLSATEM